MRGPNQIVARMPPLSADGTYPAAEAMRAMMARKIIGSASPGYSSGDAIAAPRS